MIRLLEKHNKFSWLAVILIAIAIFYISSLDLSRIKTTGLNYKSFLYHFLAFFFLAFFLLPPLVKGRKKNLIFLAVIIAVFYGISDEIHQLFVPYRFFSFADILTDSAGVLLASLSYTLSVRFRKSR